VVVVVAHKRGSRDFEGCSVSFSRLQEFTQEWVLFALKRQEFQIGETESAPLKLMGVQTIKAGFARASGKS